LSSIPKIVAEGFENKRAVISVQRGFLDLENLPHRSPSLRGWEIEQISWLEEPSGSALVDAVRR
jgi:hypothetical protein